MAMETYLQQLKFLREQMNGHEDKVAWLSAEQSEQQTHIWYLQKDLESVCDNINRAKGEVDAFSKETDNISKQLVSRRKGLEALDTDCCTLSQAWELLHEDTRKQSSRVLEMKLYYEKLEADARSKLYQYQAHYEKFAFKEETIGSYASLGQLESICQTVPRPTGMFPPAEKASGVEEKNGHGTLTDDVEMVEARDNGMGSELCLRRLQEAVQQAEEQLNRLEIENDQLEAESLPALKEEKLAEEDFVQTLRDRLDQLKNSQDILCCSCKHAYVIAYEGSKFVIRFT